MKNSYDKLFYILKCHFYSKELNHKYIYQFILLLSGAIKRWIFYYYLNIIFKILKNMKIGAKINKAK